MGAAALNYGDQRVTRAADESFYGFAADYRRLQDEARAQQQAYHANRGTMRPESNDPDPGPDSNRIVEMVYDDIEGTWVEQRKLPHKP